jgi:LytR cell envelope-related transcriptional attenuator
MRSQTGSPRPGARSRASRRAHAEGESGSPVAHILEIPLPFTPRRPRKLVFVLLSAGVLACLLAGGAFYLLKQQGARAAQARPAAHGSAPKPLLPRSRTSVLVLNGNGVNGAAGAAATVVRHLHYSVRSVGNAPRMDYPQSLVMFRPGLRREAMRFAHDLGVKLVGPLDGLRLGAIHRAKLVYVLGH